MKNYIFISPRVQLFAQLLISLTTFVIFTSSCGDVKKFQYMQGVIDTVKLSKITYKEPVIQKGDLLSITVYSDNQLASSFYNQPTTTLSAGSGGSAASIGAGYMVDDNGSIRLYQLGFIKVDGLTRKQLADTMIKGYKDLNVLTNPFIEIRFLNFKVTLIGEVNRPGVYTLPSEKVSVLDAIGLAGDVNGYARKDNILIIREVNGTRQFGRLNLLGTDFFLSPFYYLQQNDMVVVDLMKSKAAVNDQTTVRNITIAATLLTTIAIYINIFME